MASRTSKTSRTADEQKSFVKPRAKQRGASQFLPPVVIGARLQYARRMGNVPALPLFHLYGDPPDDSAFDFIHIETIASRSSVHDWTIRAHRHRNLFQILLIEKAAAR